MGVREELSSEGEVVCSSSRQYRFESVGLHG
jgi:hypothetical protein